MRVEPDELGVDARALQPGHYPQRRGAISGDHQRADATPGHIGYRAADQGVQGGQPVPHVAGGQMCGDYYPGRSGTSRSGRYSSRWQGTRMTRPPAR